MIWTDERIETLRSLAREGHSATQIAKLMGCGISRGSVIGKARREHIPMGAANNRHLGTVIERIAPIKRTRAIPVTMASGYVGNNSNHVNDEVLNLTPHQCRWPTGDVDDPDFHFCRNRTRVKTRGINIIHDVYCEAHAVLAYQPGYSRRAVDRRLNKALGQA